MRLWLDDVRPAPEGWTWVRTTEEAIAALRTGTVTEASLDHDLGEGVEEGYAVCLWMAEHGVWPPEGITIHSANVPAGDRMAGVVERYGPYRRLPGRLRFVPPSS